MQVRKILNYGNITYKPYYNANIFVHFLPFPYLQDPLN